jgi:hypothetical protein
VYVDFRAEARKTPLGISRHRWEDNIKMTFQEVESTGMVWIDLLWIGKGGGLL